MNPKESSPVADLRGRALAAKAIAEYQDGAVVSREIVSGKTGTVTAFAFDKGQGLSEHAAPFDALVLGLDGEAEIALAGAPHAVRAGDLLIMPADVPHAVKATTRFKMLLVMIRS